MSYYRFLVGVLIDTILTTLSTLMLLNPSALPHFSHSNTFSLISLLQTYSSAINPHLHLYNLLHTVSFIEVKATTIIPNIKISQNNVFYQKYERHNGVAPLIVRIKWVGGTHHYFLIHNCLIINDAYVL
jgi:hypothetical protein